MLPVKNHKSLTVHGPCPYLGWSSVSHHSATICWGRSKGYSEIFGSKKSVLRTSLKLFLSCISLTHLNPFIHLHTLWCFTFTHIFLHILFHKTGPRILIFVIHLCTTWIQNIYTWEKHAQHWLGKKIQLQPNLDWKISENSA